MIFVQRKNWPKDDDPIYVITDKINKLKKSEQVIGDFGCGDNFLKTLVPNKVLSFDMGKNDDDNSVIICDLGNRIPVENDSIHIGVLSLALMGKNYIDIIKEVYRVMAPGGRLFIAEPYQRWQNKENGVDELQMELEAEGFVSISDIVTSERFFYVDVVKVL
jgi:SAM-dependent methyltransferase